MRRVNRPTAAISVAIATGAVLVIAGCGSSSDSSTSSSASSGGNLYGSGGSTTTKPASGGSATAAGGDGIVSVADNPKLGKIIVNSKGFTLYDFHKDKGTKSACYGACAKVWPPLLSSGGPKAQGGAESSKLGTTKRTDGTTQVTYGGHPLYTYVTDKKPGDTTGNDFTSFGAQWYALTPAGEEAGD
jgi:predicted lipoprotein with Yx(FWY)xxD motif